MDTRKKMTRKDFLLEVLAATIGVALGTVIGTQVHEWLKKRFPPKRGIGIYQQLKEPWPKYNRDQYKTLTLKELEKTFADMMWKKPPTSAWVIHRKAGKVIITELN